MDDKLTAADIMLGLDSFPVVGGQTLFKETLELMGRFRLGIACVTDEHGALLGVITDGDVRRRLLSSQRPFAAFFVDDTDRLMVADPITVGPQQSLVSVVKIMGEHQVWDLPVIDENGKLAGLVHLHNAMRVALHLDA